MSVSPHRFSLCGSSLFLSLWLFPVSLCVSLSVPLSLYAVTLSLSLCFCFSVSLCLLLLLIFSDSLCSPGKGGGYFRIGVRDAITIERSRNGKLGSLSYTVNDEPPESPAGVCLCYVVGFFEQNMHCPVLIIHGLHVCCRSHIFLLAPLFVVLPLS